MKRLLPFTCAWLAGAAVAGSLAATEFQSLRYEEDYRALRDPAARIEPLDALKFVPLTGEAFLSLGGELRWRYEYFRNALWGQGPQDGDGYWLTRAMLHADVHPTQDWRLFVQLKSGLADGRTGGPRATDEDRLDWHQAFVDRTWSGVGEGRVTLRLGRQELAYGSSRLISFRESPNVRQSFDGVTGIYRTAGWRIDAFAAYPVETDAGVFDDASDRARKLWGAYAVAKVPGVPGLSVDLYYLGLERDRAVFASGAAREVRHSFGTRVWGRRGGWDYNGEFVVQTGTFGAGTIRAWTAASDNGFTFVAAPGRPRLGLRANLSSGDRAAADGRLQTFNALFPRGAYFSEMGLLGPANLTDLHPSLRLAPAAHVTVVLDWDFFWRTSTGDGLYGPAVTLVRRPTAAAPARAVGDSPSLTATWRPDPHWTLSGVVASFRAGEFLRQSGPAADVAYVSAWMTYLF